MNRADKNETVEQLHHKFATMPHMLLATFRGLTVNQANDLRRKIGDTGGEYRVIKNRLAKRAAAGTALEGLSEHFSGPCAIAAHEHDPIALAKTLADFAKDNPQLEILAGVVDSKDLVDAAGVQALSALPGLPQLRAQLLALVNTPATTLLRLVNTPATQLARVVDAHREKLESGGES